MDLGLVGVRAQGVQTEKSSYRMPGVEGLSTKLFKENRD